MPTTRDIAGYGSGRDRASAPKNSLFRGSDDRRGVLRIHRTQARCDASSFTPMESPPPREIGPFQRCKPSRRRTGGEFRLSGAREHNSRSPDATPQRLRVSRDARTSSCAEPRGPVRARTLWIAAPRSSTRATTVRGG